MPTLSHICDDCDSEFQIKYDINKTDDSPHYCPFCSSYILENDDLQGEEDD